MIFRPLAKPWAGPAAFGPLHEPVSLLPTWRKTQTGALVANVGDPSVPLNAHVPVNVAAEATHGERTATMKPKMENRRRTANFN